MRLQNKVSTFDRWLLEQYRTDLLHLAIFRIVFSVTVLAAFLPRHLWIGGFPDSFFNPPPGFTMFFGGFPSGWFFVAWNVATVTALVMLAVGLMTRTASIAFAMLWVVGNAWAYSFGKIDHDILLVLVPLTLAFGGWGARLSLDALRPKMAANPESGPALAVLALLIGYGMFTAGLAKATGGWLAWETEATRNYLLFDHTIGTVSGWMPTAWVELNVPILWKLLDYSVVIGELAFLPAVLSRRVFRMMCALFCLFHVGVLYSFGIIFAFNVLAYGAFVRWGEVEIVQAIRGMAPLRLRPGWTSGAAGSVAVAAALATLLIGLGNPAGRGIQIVIVLIGGAGAAFYLGRLAIVNGASRGRRFRRGSPGPQAHRA